MIALAVVFFGLGFNALQNAKPSKKNARIYKKVKPYMPYYLEQRFGGFSILSKEDDKKEKPPIEEVYRRLEQLEQGWGMKHLQIKGDILIIKDNNGTKVDEIQFKNPDEIKWTKQYFNLK
jgi:ribosomal protein L24E